jgi:hypothetical protein
MHGADADISQLIQHPLDFHSTEMLLDGDQKYLMLYSTSSTILTMTSNRHLNKARTTRDAFS